MVVTENALVIFAFFVVQFVFWGLFSTFSMFYMELVEDFNSTFAYMCMIGAGVASFANFVGTLPGWLIIYFSYPTVFILCGTVMCLSHIITTYCTQSWSLFFTYSMLFGLSGGILSQTSFALLLDCIDDREYVNFVTAIFSSASGFGYIFFSCSTAYLLLNTDTTWRDLFHYYSISGVVVACLAGIFLFIDTKAIQNKHTDITDATNDELLRLIPPAVLCRTEKNNTTNNNNNNNSINNNSKTVTNNTVIDGTTDDDSMPEPCGWELLCINKEFQCLFISNVLSFLSLNIPMKFSIILMSTMSSQKMIYYVVPVCMGVALILSRVFFSFLLLKNNSNTDTSNSDSGGDGDSDNDEGAGNNNNNNDSSRHKTDPFRLNKYMQIGSALMSVFLAYTPHDNVWLQLTFLALHEAVSGLFPLISMRTVQVVGIKNHHMNCGIQFTAAGLGVLIGSYLAGLIYDLTDSFVYLFLFVGLNYLLAFLWDEWVFPKERWLFRAGDGDIFYDQL